MNSASPFKRSLVLAGGGVRLAYHAGVLMALEEAGLKFDHIDGTSGGIFGTAMLSSGISPTDAAARWRKLNLAGFMKALPLGNYRNQHSLPAIGSAEGVRKKIFPALGIDVKKINANTTFDATFNVCNFTRKAIESIPHQQVTEDHLVAGISLPVFMPAVNIGGVWYTDGVWIKDANLTEAVNRGAEEIWLVWCIGNTPDYLNGAFNQYVHMIEMSASGGLCGEIDWIKEQNVMRITNQLPPVRIHLIKPEYPLPLDPDFLIGKINADTLINMGYAGTKKYLEQPAVLDIQDSATVTEMKSAATTLHFRQQFEGAIALGSEVHQLLIRLSFFVYENEGICEWRQYASVETNGGQVSPGHQHTLSVGKGIIKSGFVVDFSDLSYQVEIIMELKNPVDFLIGLDIKSARVTVGATGMEKKTAIFFQRAANRIRNAWYINVKAEQSWWNKMKSKIRLLKTVLQ